MKEDAVGGLTLFSDNIFTVQTTVEKFKNLILEIDEFSQQGSQKSNKLTKDNNS